jgi:hypothetical protein
MRLKPQRLKETLYNLKSFEAWCQTTTLGVSDTEITEIYAEVCDFFEKNFQYLRMSRASQES